MSHPKPVPCSPNATRAPTIDATDETILDLAHELASVLDAYNAQRETNRNIQREVRL